MFPNVHGFTWTAGHLIFLGIFLAVLLTIGSTAAVALWRTLRHARSGGAELLRWNADFHDLPPLARACRHEFTGEFKQRSCPRGFDCRGCDMHASLTRSSTAAPASPGGEIHGLPYPSDRLYHRGHTWVRFEEDGLLTIGLDAIGTRLAGTPDVVQLPQPGARIQVNGTAWKMRRGNALTRVLSPVDGEVAETGSAERGFYLKVKPLGTPNTTHLLGRSELKPWVSRELERLQVLLGSPALGPSLADGGVLMNDLPRAHPEADWDAVWGEAFLEP
jgi:hypothetical protein